MGFRGSLCPKAARAAKGTLSGLPRDSTNGLACELDKRPGEQSRVSGRAAAWGDSVLPGMETKEAPLEANTEVPSKGRDLGAAAASAGATCLAALGVTARTTSFPDPEGTDSVPSIPDYPKGPYVP